MHVRTTASLVSLILALLAAASPMAQQAAPSSKVIPPTKPVPAFGQLQNWIQLSKTHRIGEVDDAVRTLASWPVSQLRAIDRDLLVLQTLLTDANMKAVDAAVTGPNGHTLTLRDLPALFDFEDEVKRIQAETPGLSGDFRKPSSPARQAIARILMRAAMLHTDLLTSGSREDLAKVLSSAGSSETTLRVNDAERGTVADLDVYWSAARTTMEIVEPTPVGETLAREWYVTTGAYLLNQRDYALGVPHVEHGRARLPGEARLALYLGVMYENMASPAIQASFQNGEGALMIGSRLDLLRKAEFQFRSALLLGPPAAEFTQLDNDVRLRLGHVLMRMARPDEALPFLARAESGLRRTESKYFAALFIGLAHAELGNRTDAGTAFARAAALFPGAQSVRLAIAQLAMLGSNRDEAFASVQAIKITDRSSDPWWTYDTDIVWNVAGPLALLRADTNERLK